MKFRICTASDDHEMLSLENTGLDMSEKKGKHEEVSLRLTRRARFQNSFELEVYLSYNTTILCKKYIYTCTGMYFEVYNIPAGTRYQVPAGN